MMKRRTGMPGTQRIAYGAMAIALICVVMALSNLVTTLDLALAAIGALGISFCLSEFGAGFSAAVFFGTGLLSLFLFPVKSAPAFFLCFFGWYPFFKRFVERFPKWLSYLLKLLCAVFSLGIAYLVFVNLLSVPDIVAEFTIPAAVIALCAFFVYDFGLSKLLLFYSTVLRKKLMRK